MYIYLDMLIFILFQLPVFFYGNKVFSYLCSFFIAFETIMMRERVACFLQQCLISDTSLNSTSYWRLSTQTYEPTGNIFIQTTTTVINSLSLLQPK